MARLSLGVTSREHSQTFAQLDLHYSFCSKTWTICRSTTIIGIRIFTKFLRICTAASSVWLETVRIGDIAKKDFWKKLCTCSRYDHVLVCSN